MKSPVYRRFTRLLSATLCASLLPSLPGSRSSLAANLSQSGLTGAPNAGAAQGAGGAASFLQANPALLGDLHIDPQTPEGGALARLMGPMPAFQPQALAGVSLTEAQATAAGVEIESGIAALARDRSAWARHTLHEHPDAADTAELWRTHEELEDLLLVAPKIPGLDAREIQEARKSVEAVLAEREDAQAAKLKHPSFDGEGLARAGEPLAVRRGGPKPLLDPVIVHSDMASVDASVEHFVSHSYSGKQGSDPVQMLANFIDNYIAYQGMPDSEKHLVLKYYEIGHPHAVEAIERAVKANIRTTIITDLNQSMVGRFPKKQSSNTDFEKAKYKNSSPGKAMRYFREKLGFKFRLEDGRFTVLSGVPLFTPKNKGEKPLAHDKGAFAQGPNGKAFELSFNGSANMNLSEDKSAGPLPAFGGRFNSMQLIHDPIANQVDWEQVSAEMDAFNRRDFRDIKKAFNPVRVVYQDGSYRELLFTNGVQNPNDRITDLFDRAADPKNKIKVDEIIYSQFVLTLTDEVEALRKLMAAQPDFKVFGVFDQQFIWLDGFGEAGALAQFLVQRPFGKSVFPFRSEYEHRMELYGYQRLLDGVTKIDIDGVPIWAHLWHDKTTLVKTREIDPETGRWSEYTYVFTRSFNNSGHYQSLESQDMYRFRRDSPQAKEIEAGIKEVVKVEPQYALSLTHAIVRDWLARHTQHTPYDIDVTQYVETIVDALAKQDYSKVESLLTEISGLPIRHNRAIDQAGVQERIARFIRFLNWYAGEAAQEKSLNKMTYRKAVNIGVAIANGQNPYKMKAALDILYFNPRRPVEKTRQLQEKAWTEGLQMSAPFPGSDREDRPKKS